MLAKLSQQFGRYMVSGGIVYACDLGVFTLLNYIAPVHYIYWTVAGRVAGALVGFALHNFYTFKGEKQHASHVRALRYILLFTSNAALSVLLLRLATEYLTVPILAARIVVDVIIIILTFVISRQLVFSAKSQGIKEQ